SGTRASPLLLIVIGDSEVLAIIPRLSVGRQVSVACEGGRADLRYGRDTTGRWSCAVITPTEPSTTTLQPTLDQRASFGKSIPRTAPRCLLGIDADPSVRHLRPSL